MTSNVKHRRTKILVTIGPACEDETILRQLISTGVDGFRFNFSHGTIEDFRPQLRTIRKITEDLDTNVTCLADLQGPKIRIGKLKNEPITLEDGETVLLHADDRPTPETDFEAQIIPITHSNLAEDFTTGSKIYLNEGQITLEVTDQRSDYVLAVVKEGGRARSDKGVNLPETEFSVPAMTQKDKQDLNQIVQEDFDMVALSFVRRASDLSEARKTLNDTDRPIDLLAKIESQKALTNLDEIISAVEGIIVARGDLGVEIGPERVPFQQKRMIKKANEKGRIVITATQMLETMVDNPVPTRAEVSDVANAVLDVSDVVMLSGETAIGSFPVKTTQTMINIIRTTETDFRDELGKLSHNLAELEVQVGASMSNAAARVAKEVNAKAVVAPSSSGFTIRMVSKTHPECPIVGLSFKNTTRQKTALYRNVHPYSLDKVTRTDTLIEKSKDIVKELNLADSGDNIVLLAGLPINKPGLTNLLHVVKLS
jgi:pyruvate kinase